MEQKNKKAENGQVDTKIDAIKNLLFGENIQEYDAEFERINKQFDEQRRLHDSQLASLKHETNKLVETLQKSVTHQIATLQKEFTEQMEKLNAAKADRQVLGDLLIALGQQLKA